MQNPSSNVFEFCMLLEFNLVHQKPVYLCIYMKYTGVTVFFVCLFIFGWGGGIKLFFLYIFDYAGWVGLKKLNH